MLRNFNSLLLIYSIVLVSTLSTFAQGPSAVSKDETEKTEPVFPKTDVKKVFSKELQKSKSDTSLSEIDFKKLERNELNRTAKAKMSKKDKTTIVLVIAGFVALGIVLALTIKLKKCSQVDCDPDFDENCYCDEGN